MKTSRVKFYANAPIGQRFGEVVPYPSYQHTVNLEILNFAHYYENTSLTSDFHFLTTNRRARKQPERVKKLLS